MQIRVSVFSFVLGALIAGVLVAAPVIRAEDKSAGNKIAVVNRSAALKEYNKQKSETTRLEAEYKKLQGPIEALSKSIEADKKTLEENKGTAESKPKMQPRDLEALQDKLKAKIRDYEAESAKGQSAIDTMRQRSMEALVKDYREAVKQIGTAGGFDVVLEADPSESSHAVLYAKETLDVTNQVSEYLNTHASASAAPGAPKAKAAEGGATKKPKAK